MKVLLCDLVKDELVYLKSAQEEIKTHLSKYSYSDNRLNAVEKTLGAISDAFVFQIGLAQFELPESQLVSTA